MENPARLLKIAFGLLITGVVLPFLMVLNIIESTLPLNLLAAACSVAGLATGFIGIVQYRRRQR